MTQERPNCPTKQPRPLEQSEIRAIASRWLGPVAAERLVRGGTALTVLRTMAVNRTLAGMTMTPDVERVLEDLLAVGIDIRGIQAARGSTDMARAPDERGGAL